MTDWEREQEEYMLSKRDSEEAAAILFACIALLVLVGLCAEAWMRVFG